MCYAVDNRTSFYNLGSYWKQKVSDVPIILLGLKIDLRYEQEIDSEIKMVTYEEGSKLAEQLRCGYQEFCETKNEKQQSENIEDLFRMCLDYEEHKTEKITLRKIINNLAWFGKITFSRISKIFYFMLHLFFYYVN